MNQELIAKAATYGFVPFDYHKPAYFAVDTEPIFTKHGTPIPGRKRVVRMDTGDQLGDIVSDRYTPYTDEEVYGALELGLQQAGIYSDNIQVHMDRTKDGAMSFKQYIFPDISREINGAPVSLRILGWNSFDGTTKVKLRAGFFNWVCTNQAVAGQELAFLDQKHSGTKVALLPKVEAIASLAMNAHEHLQRMDNWSKIQLADASAKAMLEDMPGSTDALVKDLFYNYTGIKDEKGPNGGATLWAFHEVLTNWATHDSPKANIRIDRQNRVGKLVEGKVWASIENANSFRPA